MRPALQLILVDRHIPAWIDLWGLDVKNDWPTWYRMLPYHLGQLFLAEGERLCYLPSWPRTAPPGYSALCTFT